MAPNIIACKGNAYVLGMAIMFRQNENEKINTIVVRSFFEGDMLNIFFRFCINSNYASNKSLVLLNFWLNTRQNYEKLPK